MELQSKRIQGRRRRKLIQSIEKDLDQRDRPARIAKILSQAPNTKSTKGINTEVQIPGSHRHPGNTLGLLPGTRREAKRRRGRKTRSEKRNEMRARAGRRRTKKERNENEIGWNR